MSSKTNKTDRKKANAAPAAQAALPQLAQTLVALNGAVQAAEMCAKVTNDVVIDLKTQQRDIQRRIQALQKAGGADVERLNSPAPAAPASEE